MAKIKNRLLTRELGLKTKKRIFAFAITILFVLLLLATRFLPSEEYRVSFSFSPSQISTYDVVEFFESLNYPGKGSVARMWDFGDGTTSIERNPVHQYTSPGEYTVSLTMFVDGKNRGTFSRVLHVGESNSPRWLLVWNDEFNGYSVNPSKWQFEVGGWGWGNNELEYYTNGSNAEVENGMLIITAKKEEMGNRDYTSARMKTQGLFEVQYGKIEARLSVPLGNGLWPAFWMIGQNFGAVGWPRCGEIDIMEHINTENMIYGTLHWYNNGHASSGSWVFNPTPDSFHVYSVEWDSSSIKWFQDGVQYHEVSIENNVNSTEEFHQPFFIILNLAVGGNWPGSPDASTPFPAEYKVDYVRVFKPVS